MKKRQKKAKNNLLWQYGLGMTILFVVISASFLYLVSLGMKPYQTAKSEGEKLAQQYAGLEQADQVDLYNGLESYYSVLGHNKQQESLAVLIGKDDHKIYVYPTGCVNITANKSKIDFQNTLFPQMKFRF